MKDPPLGAVRKVRVGVLASGTGTIREAILAAGIDVALVVTDRPCRAIVLGGAASVVRPHAQTAVVTPTAYGSRRRSANRPDTIAR